MNRKNTLPKDVKAFIASFNEARSKRVTLDNPFNPPLPEFRVILDMALPDRVWVYHKGVFAVEYRKEDLIKIERAELLSKRIEEGGKGGSKPSSSCILVFQGNITVSFYIYDEN